MHKINCKMKAMPGALERFLRIVRVKGFTLHTLEARLDNNSFEIEFGVSGQRKVNQLLAQLSKLQDVIAIELPQPTSLNSRSY